MTNAHQRKTQRRHSAIASAVARLSTPGRRPSSWSGQRLLAGEGSPS